MFFGFVGWEPALETVEMCLKALEKSFLKIFMLWKSISEHKPVF